MQLVLLESQIRRPTTPAAHDCVPLLKKMAEAHKEEQDLQKIAAKGGDVAKAKALLEKTVKPALPKHLSRDALRDRMDPANTVVITCGNDGAVLVTDGVRLRSGVYPVEFVDGSGGGDAFDAGYIYGLLHGLGIEDCLRYASALGASCVRAIGTTPGVFTRAECEEFLKKNILKIERIC